MSHSNLFRLLTLMALTACLIGCSDDSSGDDANTPVHPAFTTYVALGDSVTQGVMSGDANYFTSQFGYTILLSREFRTKFFTPFMIATASGFFRTDPAMPPDNLGVSGMAVLLPNLPVGTVTTSADPNAFPRELDAVLAPEAVGSSVLDVAISRNPTIMTIWLGNNDLLGSIASTVDTNVADLNANTAPVAYPYPFAAKLDDADPRGLGFAPLDRTAPPAAFEAAYGAMINTLLNGTETVIAAANMPDTSGFGYLFTLAEASQFLRTYGGVSLGDLTNAGWTSAGFGFGGDPDAVVPFDLLLTAMTNLVIPNPDKVMALQLLSSGVPDGFGPLFDYDANNLDSTEAAALSVRVDALNAAIANTVSANSSRMALVDLHGLFADVVANGYQLTDTNGLPVTLYETFPIPRLSKSYPGSSSQPFDRNGGIFSLDGIHPSPTAHATVADAFRVAINGLVGSNLGAVDVFAAWRTDPFVDKDLDGLVPGFSFTRGSSAIGATVIFRDEDDLSPDN